MTNPIEIPIAQYLHDEAAAFEHVESMLWADGPVCPHCGVVDRTYRLEGVRIKPSKKNPEDKKRHACGSAASVVNNSPFAKARSLKKATYRCTSGCKPST